LLWAAMNQLSAEAIKEIISVNTTQ
jgi:hypothetical protein